MTKALGLFIQIILWSALAFAQHHVLDRLALNEVRQDLFSQGYRSWNWLESDCARCDVVFLSSRPELQTEKVRAFIQTLETSKFEILHLYRSNAQEYNLLAQMAIGILGRESKFFESDRYVIKETLPSMISGIKALRAFWRGERPSLSSRGPTQIKVVPERIARYYGVRPDNLYVPENAARATIGFLIEALQELKQRARNNNWSFVTPQTYADYLPYLYFGGVRHLRQGTATPATNLYIREMRTYMSWLEIYEREVDFMVP